MCTLIGTSAPAASVLRVTADVSTSRQDRTMDTAALVVAILALLFTVGSFWWLQARVGRLRAFEPRTFSAVVSPEQTRIILPVMLANAGPVPIVVLAMRLRFADATSETPMSWDWTRTTVDPNRGELADGANLFSVAGRSTHSLNAEFVGDFPSLVPEPRAYVVTLEALTSKADGWLDLVTFDFQAGTVKHPGNYILYSNDPDYLTEAALAEAAENLEALRSKVVRPRAQ
jgi:hypothetical protein